MEKILTNKDFYDQLAPGYDEMISFSDAIERKKKLFQKIVTSDIESAGDIGCGSGIDSIALASLGVKVTAFDPSPEMIKLTEANANRLKVDIETNNCHAHKIPAKFNNKFELVVSLGNTFANISEKDFNKSLKRCFDILKPKGTLIIQMLNYERILSVKQRIVSITEGTSKYFIRFYDFKNEKIIFNILTFNKSNPKEHTITSTRVYPHSRNRFLAQLKTLGFNNILFYSNLKKSLFEKKEAVDLVVIARKR